MKKFTELVASNIIAQAILSVLLGLFLAIWPQTTIITIVYLLAACVAISGLVSVISYIRKRKTNESNTGVLITGLFLIIIALIVFIFPEAVAGLFAFILGALLLLSGLVNVFRSLAFRQGESNFWIAMLVVSIVIAVGGIVLVVNPFESTVTFVLVLGILLVVKGVVDLVIEAMSSGRQKA